MAGWGHFESSGPIAFVKKTLVPAIRSKFGPHNKEKALGEYSTEGVRKVSNAFPCTSFLPVLECT